MRLRCFVFWLCAVFGLSCCTAQLQWLDSKDAVTVALESAPFAFLLIMPRDRSECDVCDDLVLLFEMAGRSFPFVAVVDCGVTSMSLDSKHLRGICEGLSNEPQFRRWNGAGAKEQTSLFPGPKSPQGLVQWISEGFKEMQAATNAGKAPPIQLMMPYVRQSEAMKQALERAATVAGSTDQAGGEVIFLSDQLPAWFRCLEYSFTGDGLRSVGELLEGEFLPSFGLQHKYAGRRWRMQWAVAGASREQVSFEWWDKDAELGAEGGRSSRKPLRHRVTLRRSAGADGRVGRRCAAPLPEGGGGVGAESERSVVALRTAQPGAAYDWMRFRFFEFSDHMARRIAERESALPAGAAGPVMLDPMCGQGWELALLKARFGEGLTTVCSDIHEGSVQLAQADFAGNSLLPDPRALFLVGDLFGPLAQKIATGDPSLRPRYVYALPPQEPPPPQVPEGVNEAFFFTPDGDALHFHKRIANELPPLLSEGAIVWLSVEFDKSDGVHEDFAARVEQVFAAAGWPKMRHIIDSGTPAVPYFNPSGLVEFDWGVVRDRGGRSEAAEQASRGGEL